MFYLVGLGLFDEKDISLKGLECLKNVDKNYNQMLQYISDTEKHRKL